MLDFDILKRAIAAQFERMQKHELFRAQVEKDLLWSTYLGAFPAGTNPTFRERTEHDCSCCKQFVRAIGDAVAVIDGKLESIWDVKIPSQPAYQAVADALSTLVKGAKINDLFLHYEPHAGTDKTLEQLIDKSIKTWGHFFVNIPRKYIIKNADIASTLSEPRSTKEVFMRSLQEIRLDALDTLLDLISQGSLYRGDEHKFAVDAFRKLKVQFDKLAPDAQELFAWVNSKSAPGSVSKIRGTVIGTMLTDLSEGKELEAAVGSYEAKVAPSNYKRPTALITKDMIEQAKKKLAELGLTSALERRYATLRDITVNNILFADRNTKRAMTGNVFDDLSATVGEKTKSLDKIEEVSIAKFISEILPRAESLEVLLENQHQGNLVSLIAPIDPTAGSLFKWDNNFSWSYNGEFADSIKERVKQAGGKVEGDLCCRLAWFNHDDLDFHMQEPDGNTISFRTRGRVSRSGGDLDVDMNAGSGTTRTPVENIVYPSHRTMKEGVYSLIVHQFSKRESTNVGFEVEIDLMGTIYRFVHGKAVQSDLKVVVAKMNYSKKDGLTMISGLPSTQAVRTVWGVPTMTFNKVNVVMLSPNFWDEGKVGNKHFFFMLEGCLNDGSARGFFNEFLKDSLTPHRKVFEMVGSKMKVNSSPDQLSGMGFSSTQKNTLVCRVKGSFTRTIKIVF